MGLNPMLYDGLVRQHQQELLSHAADARRMSTVRPRPYGRFQRLTRPFSWARTLVGMRVPELKVEPTVQL